jgi:hypothetical protein
MINYFHSETPYWDPTLPLRLVVLQPTSAEHALYKILRIILQANDHLLELSKRDILDTMLNLGVELSSLGMWSEAAASDALAVQLFQRLSSRVNFSAALPRLALAFTNLSDEHQYQL